MLLFVHDLTVIDSSYLCPQRGIVGESWIVDVQLDGDLNDESMVLDFGLVKKKIKSLIDAHIDHKLLVPRQNPITNIQHDGDKMLVDFNRPDHKSIHLNCPEEAFAFLDCETININAVIDHLHLIVQKELPSNILEVEFALRTEAIDTAYYHYTHGLKKHDGNCQRIAHGHRSKIIIERDGVRDSALESAWSECWRDIYLATKEDIVKAGVLDISAQAKQNVMQGHCDAHIGFSYEASQGRFEMLMPSSECEIIDTDTTVECLAQFIAGQLKTDHPSSDFKVFAFEGVGKGAIAFSG